MSMLALDSGAPPPLAPLRDAIISPANIALEQRERQAQPVGFFARLQMKLERWKLSKKLVQVNYAEHQSRTEGLKPELSKLIESYKTLDRNSDQWKEAAAKLGIHYPQWRGSMAIVRQHKDIAQRVNLIQRQLTDHEIAVNRDRLESRLRRDLEKEAKIWEQIIIDRLTRLGYCHRYSEKGKERVNKVEFAHRGLQIDRIAFKIDASYMTMFKNYKTNLPDGVRVADLISPETLFELSVACQRQVTAIVNDGGAWLFVNRLESIDGLMNYVRYEDVMERYPHRYRDRIPVCVGVGHNREVKWVNFSDFPHWLIAGYTKAGKSNMANVILCTLISQYSPDEVRLALIDLKGGLEFGDYAGVPHLLGGIVDSVGGVADVLAVCEALMEDRFREMRGIARKIEDYQLKRPTKKMPRIFIMIDEGASVLNHGETTKEINARLQQITSKGRAVGLHVIYCTQRPDKEVVKGSIKVNFAFRLSGRLVTSADSVTVLGNAGAKDIAPVEGRMMMQIGADPEQVQTPHINEAVIYDCIKHAMTMPAAEGFALPAPNRRVFQEWTVERIIELSIKHLGGNITWKAIYESADELTQAQARKLVEQIWYMDIVEFESKQYHIIKGKGGARKLVEIEPAAA